MAHSRRPAKLIRNLHLNLRRKLNESSDIHCSYNFHSIKPGLIIDPMKSRRQQWPPKMLKLFRCQEHLNFYEPLLLQFICSGISTIISFAEGSSLLLWWRVHVYTYFERGTIHLKRGYEPRYGCSATLMLSGCAKS